MDIVPPLPAQAPRQGLMGWLLLPAGSLSDQTVRIISVSYAGLALLFVPLFPHSVTFLWCLAFYILINLSAAAMVGRGRGVYSRVVVGYLAAAMVYLAACAMYPQAMAGTVIGPRLILLAQAVSPFLIYRADQRGRTIINTLFNCALLLSVDFGIGHWPADVKMHMDALNTFAGRTICTLQALIFLMIVFWSYKRNTLQKEREIRALLDVLTENAATLNDVNGELRNSQAALLELNQNKDKLFSIIAHDLRTPLNSFEAFSSLLAEHIDQLSADEVRQMSHQMRASHEQVRALLENLLAWSRSQMNLLDYQPAATPLQPLLEQIMRLYASAAADKQLRLELACPMGLVAETDANLLAAVVRNLASNAIKYSYEGGLVSITAQALAGGKGTEISVTDQGTGMEPEQVERLFKVERKSSMPGTRNERGTGLGLVLVADFLALMGSTLQLDTAPGRGTRASFTLPPAPTADVADSRQLNLFAKPGGRPKTLHNATPSYVDARSGQTVSTRQDGQSRH